MKKKSTGNGRRQSYSHIPMPRMTNTYMLSGNHEHEEQNKISGSFFSQGVNISANNYFRDKNLKLEGTDINYKVWLELDKNKITNLSGSMNLKELNVNYWFDKLCEGLPILFLVFMQDILNITALWPQLGTKVSYYSHSSCFHM